MAVMAVERRGVSIALACRTITLPSLTGSLQSDYSAWTGQIFAEAAYSFNVAEVEIEPFGGVSYNRSHFNGFQEYGLTDVALSG